MTRFFTLFDKKAGKIVARYQQVFGIKRLIERINQKRKDGVKVVSSGIQPARANHSPWFSEQGADPA